MITHRFQIVVTIANQKNDYCDTITIAEIPVAVLLLLQAAIAIALR